jgi:hypothetical protein
MMYGALSVVNLWTRAYGAKSLKYLNISQNIKYIKYIKNHHFEIRVLDAVVPVKKKLLAKKFHFTIPVRFVTKIAKKNL